MTNRPLSEKAVRYDDAWETVLFVKDVKKAVQSYIKRVKSKPYDNLIIQELIEDMVIDFGKELIEDGK
jgi:hypothetical protein